MCLNGCKNYSSSEVYVINLSFRFDIIFSPCLICFCFCSDEERIGTKRKKVRHIQNFFGDGGGAGFGGGAGGNDGGDINKGMPHNLWLEGSGKKNHQLMGSCVCSTPLQ